jgi:hypothetical protein
MGALANGTHQPVPPGPSIKPGTTFVLVAVDGDLPPPTEKSVAGTVVRVEPVQRYGLLERAVARLTTASALAVQVAISVYSIVGALTFMQGTTAAFYQKTAPFVTKLFRLLWEVLSSRL